jgi:hypothetical protein
MVPAVEHDCFHMVGSTLLRCLHDDWHLLSNCIFNHISWGEGYWHSLRYRTAKRKGETGLLFHEDLGKQVLNPSFMATPYLEPFFAAETGTGVSFSLLCLYVLTYFYLVW